MTSKIANITAKQMKTRADHVLQIASENIIVDLENVIQSAASKGKVEAQLSLKKTEETVLRSVIDHFSRNGFDISFVDASNSMPDKMWDHKFTVTWNKVPPASR